MADDQTVTLTIESDEGDVDEIEVSTALLEMLAEGDEPPATVVGDIATFGLAQRAHSAVHHSDGEPPAELADAEETMLDLFEDRFGATFGELTGHQH